MSELGSLSKIVTESSLVKSGQGKVRGLVVTSNTSGTIVLKDGLSNLGSVRASSTLTLSCLGLVPAKYAANTLTSNGTDVSEDNTLTFGDRVYRFKATPVALNDIDIGGTAAATLDNIKAVVNGTYSVGIAFAGTLVHPDIIATTNTDTTQLFVSRVIGTANNTLATTEAAATLSFPEVTLGGASATVIGVATAGATFTIGGRAYYFTTSLAETHTLTAIVDQILWVTNDATALDNMKTALNGTGTIGTDYSTGTAVSADVVATTNGATTQVIEAILDETAGNAVTTTEGMAEGAWTSTVLTGGTNAAVPLTGTITYGAGSSVITFPDAINFSTGLYAFTNATVQSTTVIFT